MDPLHLLGLCLHLALLSGALVSILLHPLSHGHVYVGIGLHHSTELALDLNVPPDCNSVSSLLLGPVGPLGLCLSRWKNQHGSSWLEPQAVRPGWQHQAACAHWGGAQCPGIRLYLEEVPRVKCGVQGAVLSGICLQGWGTEPRGHAAASKGPGGLTRGPGASIGQLKRCLCHLAGETASHMAQKQTEGWPPVGAADWEQTVPDISVYTCA